jgi:hypothetical protein
MKKLPICCAVVALFFSSAFCYNLSFYIFDAKTNQEISETTIHITGNGLNLSIAYSAGSSDVFNFAGGTYTFTFSAAGYKDSSVTATLGSAKSFSIGLKLVTSIRNAGSHAQTPPAVLYDKNSSLLHIAGKRSECGSSAINLFTPDGRKVFPTILRADAADLANLSIPVPALAKGVYFLMITAATKQTMKALRVQ